MIEVVVALKDFQTKSDWVGVSVAHSLVYFDLVVEAFGIGCGEPGFDIGLDIFSIPTDGLCEFQERIQF